MDKLCKVESKTHDTYDLVGSVWHVSISHNTRDNNHYFENQITGASGILEITGKMVIGYDGVFELPKSVCKVLSNLGYTFDKNILPE